MKTTSEIEYLPLVIVKSRVTPSTWERRVAAAKKASETLEEIEKHVANNMSLNEAILLVVPKSRRSWVIRFRRRYKKYGWQGLVDTRIPRAEDQAIQIRNVFSKVPDQCRKLKPKAALLLLQKEMPDKPLPSRTTIKREIQRQRRLGGFTDKEKLNNEVEVIDLPLAGGELILAAENETGAMAALRDEVMAIGQEAVEASVGQVPTKDGQYRNRRGQFTKTYNKKRRRKNGEEIARYLRTAEEKSKGRVPSWPRFVREQPETILAKISTLIFEPMVSRIKGWAGLRSPEAAGLEPLTTFAYMPSTLSKFTSALAISNAGDRLLETTGNQWHKISQKYWGENGAMASLYVDNQAKEVWTSLFTQSGKVSRLNRVMPSITTTYVHTGAGTPLVVGVRSGSAPLAPQLLQLVEKTEETLGGEIRRATIIDSEGSTFNVLETFTQANRLLITPLRRSRAPELELRFGKGSYFRSYRENDELRVGEATLHHRTTGRSLDVRALIVRRAHRKNDTILLATVVGSACDIENKELADLYFSRWPLQENYFKAASVVRLEKHRGNSARIVTNVAVVTKTERLKARLEKGRPKLEELRKEGLELEKNYCVLSKMSEEAGERLKEVRCELDKLVSNENAESATLANVAKKLHSAMFEAEKTQESATKLHVKIEKNRSQEAKLETQLKKAEVRIEHLKPQMRIRQLDVALDKVLTAVKLTSVQLMVFVIKEYLGKTKITPQTFVSRLFSFHGRKEVRKQEERILFYENPRDPEMTEALRHACMVLNERRLTRCGRKLNYSVVQDSGER